MEMEEIKKAKRVKKLVDIQILLDVPREIYRGYSYLGLERVAYETENWAKDFNQFLMEHSSRSSVRVTVDRIYKDYCSVCEHEWESYYDEENKILTCANCGCPI
jgi:hypothetical protein